MSNNNAIQIGYESDIKEKFRPYAEYIYALECNALTAVEMAAEIGQTISSCHQQFHKGQDVATWLKPLVGDCYRDALVALAGRSYRRKLKGDNYSDSDQLVFAFEALKAGEAEIANGPPAKPTAHDSSPFAAFSLDLLRIQRSLAPFRQASPPKKWGQTEADQIIPLLKDVADYIAEVKEAGWL